MNWNRANSPPCTTARRGGRAFNQMLRSLRSLRGRGGFPIENNRKSTPSAAASVAARNFLMPQTPLLAVVQGGEFAHDSNSFTRFEEGSGKPHRPHEPVSKPV